MNLFFYKIVKNLNPQKINLCTVQLYYSIRVVYDQTLENGLSRCLKTKRITVDKYSIYCLMQGLVARGVRADGGPGRKAWPGHNWYCHHTV